MSSTLAIMDPLPPKPPLGSPPGVTQLGVTNKIVANKSVKLNEMPWFHGKILREEAELLLRPDQAQDGLFLVRESTNFPGDYTLCVVFQNKVEHYRVIAKNNSLTIDEEEFFENLTKLVEVRFNFILIKMLSYLINILLCKFNFIVTKCYII